jgi:hypothetical protein
MFGIIQDLFKILKQIQQICGLEYEQNEFKTLWKYFWTQKLEGYFQA